MQPWEFIIGAVFLIPIVAIIGGLGTGVIKMLFSHLERKAEIRTQTLQAGDSSLRSEIEALRSELARLRDTSTQYDISIQHTLEELNTRVATLESQRRPNGVLAPPAQENAEQTVLARPGN